MYNSHGDYRGQNVIVFL